MMARDEFQPGATGDMSGPATQGTAVAEPAAAGEQGTGSPDRTDRPTGQRQHVQDEAKRGASHVASQASESASRAAGHAREAVTDASRRMRDQGTSAIAAQKDRAAEELSHVSRAIHRAADTLHEEGDHNIADYAEMAAAKIDDATHYIRDRDLGGLVDDAEAATRSRPELVYGGMFIAGLALSRFLKSSSRNRARGMRGESQAAVGTY